MRFDELRAVQAQRDAEAQAKEEGWKASSAAQEYARLRKLLEAKVQEFGRDFPQIAKQVKFTFNDDRPDKSFGLHVQRSTSASLWIMQEPAIEVRTRWFLFIPVTSRKPTGELEWCIRTNFEYYDNDIDDHGWRSGSRMENYPNGITEADLEAALIDVIKMASKDYDLFA